MSRGEGVYGHRGGKRAGGGTGKNTKDYGTLLFHPFNYSNIL